MKKSVLISMIEAAREAWENGDMAGIAAALEYPAKPEARGGGRPVKYPWATMEVGESFLVDAVPYKSATAQAANAGRRYGRRFTCYADGTLTVVKRVA